MSIKVNSFVFNRKFLVSNFEFMLVPKFLCLSGSHCSQPVMSANAGGFAGGVELEFRPPETETE